jgi:hypothetical protein
VRSFTAVSWQTAQVCALVVSFKLTKLALSSSKACCASGVHSHATPLCNRAFKGTAW